MALKEHKVFVRQNSEKTTDYLVVKYKRLVNQWTEHESNIKDDGNYLFLYYASIFDTRNNKNRMVFCDKATEMYEIANSYKTEGGRIIKGVIDTTPFLSEDGSVNVQQSSQTSTETSTLGSNSSGKNGTPI